MIYLSIPYTDMEELSFKVSCLAAAFFMNAGRTVFSPIIQSHILVNQYDVPKDHDFWLKQDLEILRRCDEMCVITLEGWENSIGVQRELEEACRLGIPVVFVDPEPFIPKITKWEELCAGIR